MTSELLGPAIEHVFGRSPGRLRDPAEIQVSALDYNHASWNGDQTTCRGIERLVDRDDVFTALCEGAMEDLGTSALHLAFLDAIVAAVPYRYETLVVEIAPPHRLWLCDNGRWSLRAEALFARPVRPVVHLAPPDDPLRVRRRRARWLYPLLPRWVHLSPRAAGRQAWIRRGAAGPAWREDGAPDARELLRRWRASERGCGDALAAAWGTFFLGARGAFDDLAAELAGHPAAAVRSAIALARRVDAGERSRIHDLLRDNRTAFLAHPEGPSGNERGAD